MTKVSLGSCVSALQNEHLSIFMIGSSGSCVSLVQFEQSRVRSFSMGGKLVT